MRVGEQVTGVRAAGTAQLADEQVVLAVLGRRAGDGGDLRGRHHGRVRGRDRSRRGTVALPMTTAAPATKPVPVIVIGVPPAMGESPLVDCIRPLSGSAPR